MCLKKASKMKPKKDGADDFFTLCFFKTVIFVNKVKVVEIQIFLIESGIEEKEKKAKNKR